MSADTESIEAERQATIGCKKSPEQVKKEKQAQQRRQARWDAEERKRQEHSDREEQGRIQRLRPLAERISAVIEPQAISDLVAILNSYNDTSTLCRLLTEMRAPAEPSTRNHADSEHTIATLELPQATEVAA